MIPATVMPAAVLWDLDGTLVDSEETWRVVAEGMLADVGLTMSPELGEALIGADMEVAGTLLGRAGLPGAPAAIAGRLVADVTRLLEADPPPFRPGARDALATLVAAGVPLALVTMSYRAQAEIVVAGLPIGTFAAVVAGDEVERGKPDPEAYLAAATALGVDARDCVAVEDSVPGATAAVAAGAATISLSGPGLVPGLAAHWDTLVGRTPADFTHVLAAHRTERTSA